MNESKASAMTYGKGSSSGAMNADDSLQKVVSNGNENTEEEAKDLGEPGAVYTFSTNQ